MDPAPALMQPPGSPSSCTESDSAMPTNEELRAMGVEQLTRRIDPHLLVDLQGVAPGVMQGLMSHTASNNVGAVASMGMGMPVGVGMGGCVGGGAVPPQGATAVNVPVNGPPPPLGVPPPLNATLMGGGVGATGAGSSGAGSASAGPSGTASGSSSVTGVRRGFKSDDSDMERREKRKQLRAERNRQSAASSRERKKRHLRELQRRLEVFKAENTRLHTEFNHAQEHLDRIQKMLEYRDKMATSLDTKDEDITEIERKFLGVQESKKVALEAETTAPAGSGTTPKPLRKPRTWDNKRIGLALRNFPF